MARPNLAQSRYHAAVFGSLLIAIERRQDCTSKAEVLVLVLPEVLLRYTSIDAQPSYRLLISVIRAFIVDLCYK